ncbi:MAG TPA: aminotransferase class V-fold PLP-dependent enzyme [Bacteroidota bacterium]
MNDDLLRWRNEFPILEHKTYLISNSLGAMPRSVSARMQEYADTWATKGVKAWADAWWEMPVRVGDRIAPLIGAKPGDVTMHPNSTTLQAIILSCFEGGDPRRTKVVSEAFHFPSILYVTERWVKCRGGTFVLIDSDDGVTIELQKMLDAIDEQTLLVSISHVLFKSAFVQDVKAIVEKAHRVGAFVVLDAYHSVGIMPVDVRALDVDFLTGGVLKWLCGGPGGAFLYAHPERTKHCQPNLTGWFAHPKPFQFKAAPMEYREDAGKFLNGTPAIPALYAATEGPRIIQQVGVETIREKSVRQTSLLIRLAQQHGFTVHSPLDPSQRGGTVTIDVPHGYAVTQVLLARDILVDYREGAGIRIAPHFYNSDEEVERVMSAMVEILQNKSYEQFASRRSVVT